MSKSHDAFRTISEVSDVLDTPAHVLRFWESKFSQVKPVKRAGGRRYYRPGDVDLLAGIKKLLHVDGMTIKGAQKLMREQGVKHVTAIGAEIMGSVEGNKPAPIDSEAELVVEHETPAAAPEPTVAPAPSAKQTTPHTETASDNVVPLQATAETPKVTGNTPEPASEPAAADAVPAPTTTAARPDIPADPSDSDSKAPARLFHLLRAAPPDALHARAADISPLLDRMRALRGRISLR